MIKEKESYFLTKPCPFCGNESPRIMPYRWGIGMVVRCPNCWSITKVKHTRLLAIDAWENGEWSEETLAFANNPRTAENIDITGAIRLASAILSDAADEYRFHLRMLWSAKSEAERKRHQYDIDRCEKYFRTNPFIHFLPLTGDDVIAQLRRQVEKEGKYSNGYRTIIRKDG